MKAINIAASKTRIAVLGCGWLGLPLAHRLTLNGYQVRGSVTGDHKLQTLIHQEIEPHRLQLLPSGIEGDAAAFLKDADTVIINIPPKATNGNYTDALAQIVPFIEGAGVKHVLFVSSTSVYGDAEGIVTEETAVTPSGSAAQIAAAEQLFRQAATFTTTILRFGGLIGNGRHPVKHLAGRMGVADPDAPVNLIDREDCIGIILAILEKEAWGYIFNGVAPEHPTRKHYYTAKALTLGLVPPQFGETGSMGKTVTSVNVPSVLQYQFTQSL